jgi:heterodisulfide reductase subunit D
MENHPLFVLFFMFGSIVFLFGIILKFLFYLQGRWKFLPVFKGIISTLLSKRFFEYLKILILDGILQRRLLRQDILRWLTKILIMIGYPSIIISGHLKVESMEQFEGFSHIIKFFYAPFCDFYFFRDIKNYTLSTEEILFAISFDLFGAMILSGEFIAIFRRFIVKTSIFKTTLDDIIAVNLLGGWFILRFLCEATSILAFSIPDSVAQYWFVSFGLSKIFAPIPLNWSSINYPIWSISGLLIGSLVGFIPFNKKLWHIVTIPITMFIKLIPTEVFKYCPQKIIIPFSLDELISIDSCVKCGSCVNLCPVFGQKQNLEITMGGLFNLVKSFLRKTYGIPEKILHTSLAINPIKDFSIQPYLCTLCGRCSTVCPALIDTKKLRIATRRFMVEKGFYPQNIERLLDNLNKVHNILGETNENRTLWLEGLSGVPQHRFDKEKARVIYFVGCVASLFPMTKKIPLTFVQILQNAEVDFTLLGGEEWCCGFPLIAAGMEEKAQSLIKHNLMKVKEKGAKKIIFSCPSCYHTWLEYKESDIEIFHSTQYIYQLINEGRITFKENKVKITYHDPCDLGRASGIYEIPRNILKTIPGVELIEMKNTKDQSVCCGGGGNLEMIDPELSSALALSKIEEIRATGAEIVVTACQQCVRTILTTARRKKLPISVIDIIEFVYKNMAHND